MRGGNEALGVSIGKAIHGMVSKSSGRNESERIGAVENLSPEAELIRVIPA
jgi:hypothetical protein